MSNPHDIEIANLLLDMDNPRVEPAKHQPQQMQQLLDDQGDNIKNLAEDIVEYGISPIDLLLVMPSSVDGKFIALEGNRRILALKILSNPHVLGGLTMISSLRKKLEQLAGDFKGKPIDKLSCYEVKSRDEARHWLELRHIGQSQGAGVVGWSGVATARFRGNDPALQALELVARSGRLSNEDAAQALSLKFPITTLRRLLESRDVKDFLGLEVKGQKLQSSLPADELIKPLKRMVMDLIHGKITVSDIKRKKQQIEYVERFPPGDRADLKKAGTMRPVQDIIAADFTGKPGGAGTRKKRNVSPDRKHIVPNYLKLPIKDSKANEIYHELRELWIDDTPHSCAVLLRVFLELTTDHYCDKFRIARIEEYRPGHKRDRSLAEKAVDAIDHLVAAGAKKADFMSLRSGIKGDDNPLSAKLLNAYVHNKFTKPKPRELRDAWDHAQPFFEQAWERINK